ncbi:Carbohydrate binding domain protein [compost metagenome]
MKNVSESQDKVINLTLGSNTTITNPIVLKQLSPGDKLKFPNGQFAWVTKSYPWPSTPKYFLIDELGNEFSIAAGTYSVQVYSSGRSNEITANMQQVVTKTDPLLASPTQITFPASGIISAEVVTFRDKLNALCGSNPEGQISNNNLVAVGTANPYLFGLRGDLAMDNQLNWQGERIQATANGVRKDGAYTSFVPFYAKATSGEWYPLTHISHPNYNVSSGNYSWRKSGEITLYNQYGAPLEAKDEIKVNAAQLYGYNPKLELLPVASVVNAHKQDIAFDSFEDYSHYSTQPMTSFKTHFAFEPSKNDNLVFSTDYRHSGKTSLVLVGNRSVSGVRTISPFQDAKTIHVDNATNTGQVQNCDCIQTFAPTPGEYVVSAWVKQPSASAGNIGVTIHDASNNVLGSMTFSTNGTSLDGWQRIEGGLTIPGNAAKITVTLNNSSVENVYFDDFRMHPVLAGMTTTVYDPVTLLKIATHDGYNYTTFYNYDENNQLVRVRVETIEGIKTISESEMSIYKQP